jgi:hypothetical protein
VQVAKRNGLHKYQEKIVASFEDRLFRLAV